jgi:hypothetical protein
MKTDNTYINAEREGSEELYALINTTDYNDDNKCGIAIATADELSLYGWEETPILGIGEIYESDEFIGAYIMRVA